MSNYYFPDVATTTNNTADLVPGARPLWPNSPARSTDGRRQSIVSQATLPAQSTAVEPAPTPGPKMVIKGGGRTEKPTLASSCSSSPPWPGAIVSSARSVSPRREERQQPRSISDYESSGSDTE
ncbi:hypothetical protein L873DRAFT_1846375 [Choiromyces venosus 120613-1]|uniref:Uncharacterized protein n=1 Tax=Choiromyces venosus 120613-1 TaxID=1336337 RepID=A0A3N4J983_9PEZI|nr:hypothetical protein L873DRAFT_1846375 [Choiromyces venosus 120613-1]